MVGVVVIMAVMAITLLVAVQTATFARKRENEAELIFRAEQFVEGVRIFRARNGRFPLTLDELVKAQPRAMRKRWVDPITREFDWVPIFVGQTGQAVNLGGGAQPTPTPVPPPDEDERDEDGQEGPGRLGQPGEPAAQFPATDARGPIVGVHSRSRDKAVREREGRSRYCDWQFTLEQAQQGRGRQPQPRPTARP